jgi:hypothetical protein
VAEYSSRCLCFNYTFYTGIPYIAVIDVDIYMLSSGIIEFL